MFVAKLSSQHHERTVAAQTLRYRRRPWSLGQGIRYWEAVHLYTLGGAYVNFMMDEGLDRNKATYRNNYNRLTEVKRKYDPDNFFHVNQNIRPE